MNRFIFFVFIVVITACSSTKKEEIENKAEKSNLFTADSTSNEMKLTMRYNSFDTVVDVLFTETDTLNEVQKKNYDDIISKQDLLTPEILKKIFDYYKNSYPDYKSGWAITGKLTNKELEKYLPTPTTPEKLKSFITPAIIHIQNKKDCKNGTFGIEFDCTWDMENGLGVLIQDWKVVNVSVAEVSYF
jgi:hypothetical protein